MKRKLLLALLVIGLLAFVAGGVQNVVGNRNKIALQGVQLQNSSNKIKLLQLKSSQLNDQLQHELQQKNVDQDKVKQLEQQNQQLQQQTEDLQKQVSLKAAQKQQQAQAPQVAASQVVNTVTGTAVASADSVGNCGDNIYKQYIYQHESGCNTDRWNTSGCYGIGQACPASKVKDQCGADFTCQDAWFTQYANATYGGWEGAYNAWLRQGWW